jgi:hypothetical protein
MPTWFIEQLIWKNIEFEGKRIEEGEFAFTFYLHNC